MALVVYLQSVNINLPGFHQGFKPEQPIAFSHRLHSGDLQIECLYCHGGAEKSRHAGIPSAGTCMNCHRFVTAGWDDLKIEEQRAAEEKRDLRLLVSQELEKLYKVVGFSTDQSMYTEVASGSNLSWVRVYQLPDFVYFDHRPHVNAGVRCEACHGNVAAMERVAQETDLSMGWCVNCHRDVNRGNAPELEAESASTDCGVCHY